MSIHDAGAESAVHTRRRANANASLVQVAERAGVSVGTVSKVLNGVTRGFSVKEQVRKRIELAVRELNYRADPLARLLRRNDCRVVGITSPRWIDFTGVYYTILISIVQKLRALDIRPCLSFPPAGEWKVMIEPWMRDGVIVLHANQPEELADLDDLNIPYVSVNGATGANGSLVGIDDEAGTLLALRHFYDAGHRDIAFAGHRGDDAVTHTSMAVREAAYLSFMREIGRPPTLLYRKPPDLCGALRELLAQRRITALLGYDQVAMGAFHLAARDEGLVVPRDISFIAFNDAELATLLSPAMTVVAMPEREMAELAVQILEDMTADLTLRKQVMLAPTLIARDSVVPPP